MKEPGATKARRFSVTGKSRGEAIQKARAIRKRNHGVSGTAVTLGEWLLYWLDTFVCNLRINTRSAYESAVKNHIMPKLGGIPLVDLRPSHVSEMLADLLKNHAPSTVTLIRNILAKCINQATTIEKITRPIMKSVITPRRERKDPIIFSREELQRFIEHTGSSKYRLAHLLFVGAGLRLGEALALKWSDVSLPLASITVRKTLVRSRGGMLTNPAKTKLSRRTIPIPPFLVLAFGDVPEDQRTDLVVSGRWGDYLSPVSIRSDLKRILIDAGLPRVTIHGLRHIHASILIASGVDIFEVSRRLGHSNISTTADIYGHLVPGKSGAAVSAIQDMMVP